LENEKQASLLKTCIGIREAFDDLTSIVTSILGDNFKVRLDALHGIGNNYNLVFSHKNSPPSDYREHIFTISFALNDIFVKNISFMYRHLKTNIVIYENDNPRLDLKVFKNILERTITDLNIYNIHVLYDYRIEERKYHMYDYIYRYMNEHVDTVVTDSNIENFLDQVLIEECGLFSKEISKDDSIVYRQSKSIPEDKKLLEEITCGSLLSFEIVKYKNNYNLDRLGFRHNKGNDVLYSGPVNGFDLKSFIEGTYKHTVNYYYKLARHVYIAKSINYEDIMIIVETLLENMDA
jgi:hypothetical protein